MKIMKCAMCEKDTEVLNEGVDYVICAACLKRIETMPNEFKDIK
jgi:hypothetical protein